MSTKYQYTKTDHLEWRSLFHNIQLPSDDNDLLDAITFWEKTSDDKYIDILGYGQIMLYGSVDQRECASMEIENIVALLETGKCQLLTNYSDFDTEQISPCYENLVKGINTDFISVAETQAYLEADRKWQENYDEMLKAGVEDERIDNLPELNQEQYFSRKWIVATQVQALVWYKEYLKEVVKNGVNFRDPDEIGIPNKPPYSCGDKLIHKVIDLAFYKLLDEKKKTKPAKVLIEIYTDYLHFESLGRKREIDLLGIITECQSRLSKNSPVIKWKAKDGISDSVSKSQFISLVNDLNDNQSPVKVQSKSGKSPA